MRLINSIRINEKVMAYLKPEVEKVKIFIQNNVVQSDHDILNFLISNEMFGSTELAYLFCRLVGEDLAPERVEWKNFYDRFCGSFNNPYFNPFGEGRILPGLLIREHGFLPNSVEDVLTRIPGLAYHMIEMMLIKKAISPDEAKILAAGIYASTTSSPYSTAAGYYNTDNMSVFSRGTNSASFFSSVEDYIYADYIQSFLLGHGVVNALKVSSGEEPDTEVALRIGEITDQETISFVRQYFKAIEQDVAYGEEQIIPMGPSLERIQC